MAKRTDAGAHGGLRQGQSSVEAFVADLVSVAEDARRDEADLRSMRWARRAADRAIVRSSAGEVAELVAELGLGRAILVAEDAADLLRPIMRHLLLDHLVDAMCLSVGQRPYWGSAGANRSRVGGDPWLQEPASDPTQRLVELLACRAAAAPMGPAT